MPHFFSRVPVNNLSCADWAAFSGSTIKAIFKSSRSAEFSHNSGQLGHLTQMGQYLPSSVGWMFIGTGLTLAGRPAASGFLRWNVFPLVVKAADGSFFSESTERISDPLGPESRSTSLTQTHVTHLS